MNDEINRESVAIVFKATRISGDVLQKAFNAYLANRRKASFDKRAAPQQGKMKVSELLKKEENVASIDVADKGIRTFQKVAKKYHVDFAIKKDNAEDVPKYVVFFKAKDEEVISRAFKEYVKLNEKKKEKQPIREKLKELKQTIKKDRGKKRTRNKNRQRNRELSH